jgi:hypothetical protein
LIASCYLRRGIAYIPTKGQIGTGHYRDVDPVAVVSVPDTDDLRNALRETFARGNPIVSSLPRYDRPDPVVLKYAGVKTFSAFARGTLVWRVEEREDVFKIVPQKNGQPRGWVDDNERTVEFPPGAVVDEVCDRLISMIQAAAGVA